jgi:hypothetical protein
MLESGEWRSMGWPRKLESWRSRRPEKVLKGSNRLSRVVSARRGGSFSSLDAWRMGCEWNRVCFSSRGELASASRSAGLVTAGASSRRTDDDVLNCETWNPDGEAGMLSERA